MNVPALEKLPVFAESWNVAFREKPMGTILEDRETPFVVIPNPFRYWAADPFVIRFEGKTCIFVELYDYIRRRGVLGYCEISGGKAGKWKPVIREGYHLSYPCLMESGGKLYLMPESGEGEVLTVYEAVRFPDQWEKRVLRTAVKFADTTPVPRPGHHLALTHRVDDPERPRLTLIDLEGKLDDRVIDGRQPLRSRPAGHCFEKDGQSIRPGQISLDIGRGYGKGLVFCQWTLDENLCYREWEIRKLYPEELSFDKRLFLDGMHTYNGNDQYEVIDIKTRRFNILNFAMRIVGKILRS